MMRPFPFQVLAALPSSRLTSPLQKELADEGIGLVSIPDPTKLPAYIQRVRPAIILIYISPNSRNFEGMARYLMDLRKAQRTWTVLLVDRKADMETIRNQVHSSGIFLRRYEENASEIVHNILSIRDIIRTERVFQHERHLDTHLKHCLRLIYQYQDSHQLFERLVNYCPKVIPIDFWAIYGVDPDDENKEFFAHFAPPQLKENKIHREPFVRMIRKWLVAGDPLYTSRTDNPELFRQLKVVGWPIEQLYFVPLKSREKGVVGIVAGHRTRIQLTPPQVSFINEINGFLVQKILNSENRPMLSAAVDGFADQLILNQFNEEQVFGSTCQKLQEVTNSDSVIYWQFNKGFGFLFPKYHSFREGQKPQGFSERTVLFLQREPFLNGILDSTEIQVLEQGAADPRMNEATQKVFKALNYGTVLVLPSRTHGEVTGAILINRVSTEKPYTAEEIEYAGQVLTKTQHVLENAHTVKEANLKLKQLSKIFELGGEIKLDLTLDELIERITQNLRKALGWNDIGFLLEDEFGATLRTHQVERFKKGNPFSMDLNNQVSLDQFYRLLEKCEQIGVSYFCAGGDPPKNGDLQSAKQFEWHDDDLLVIPLETRNRTLGFLIVQDPVDRLRPTLEKVIPLEYYANQAAVAVENGVLYEALRSSQEQYRALAETMTLALVTCNMKGEIVYVNPAYRRTLEFEEDPIGRPFLSLVADGSEESFEEILTVLLAENSDMQTSISDKELVLISDAGERIPFSVLGFPLFERREKTGFFLVLNDLRIIKRLERMKADFNSMIVHDLRSPMNVIQGFIELIRNQVVGEVNPEQEELLDIARENVTKVLSLVDNFLVASKLDVGRFSIDPKLDEINSLIEKQVNSHRMLVKTKNFDLNLALDKNLPLVLFDTLRIEQVLNNLLSNAMKFTPEDGKILVTSKLMHQPDEDDERYYALISVKDSGVGIPADQIDTIFDKYEQVDENQMYNFRGTGLGLSICKEIVELHGGEIWVESTAGEGSEFFFTLPIEAQLENIVK